MDKIERCIMQILWINCSVPDWTLYVIEKYTKSTCPQRCWIRGKVILPPASNSASWISYSNITSWLGATTVQWAVDLLKTQIDALSWGWPVVIPKETSYWTTAPTLPQTWDRRVDTSWWLPWIDNVWNWTSWVGVVWAWAPVASTVVWIPSTWVTNQWVWPLAQISITLTAPAWKTFDYVEYFTDWQYWIAVFNWSWFTVTSNKSATLWYDQFLYYNEYWFLWSNKWSYITYGSPTSATITLYVSDSAAVASINWIWAVHYK